MYLSANKLASSFQSMYYKPFGSCEKGSFCITKKEFELLASNRNLSISNDKFCMSLLKKLKDLELMLTPHDNGYLISDANTASHTTSHTVRHITKPVLYYFFKKYWQV